MTDALRCPFSEDFVVGEVYRSHLGRNAVGDRQQPVS